MFFIFPYRIRRPFKMPWATVGIMAACVAVFALQSVIGIERSFLLLGFRPDPAGLVTWFTAMFAHAGVGHLLGNLYFLWIFGGVLEDAVGRTRYLLLYVTGGLVAALFHTLVLIAFDRSQVMIPTIGASGAVAAIMGLSAVRFARLKIDVWYLLFMVVSMRTGTFGVPAFVGVALYLLREVGGGVMSALLGSTSVAHWAHVGGLLFGIAVAYAFGLAKDLEREEAEREAEGWAAVGRMDLAHARLSDTTSDSAEAALARARQVLSRPVPEIAHAGTEVRSALSDMLEAGRRDDAADTYEEFRAYVESSAFLDAAMLASVGSACESIGRRNLAAHAYYHLLRHFPGSREAERALFRLAHVYLAQGRQSEANQTWEAFCQHFPRSAWRAHADERFRAYA